MWGNIGVANISLCNATGCSHTSWINQTEIAELNMMLLPSLPSDLLCFSTINSSYFIVRCYRNRAQLPLIVVEVEAGLGYPVLALNETSFVFIELYPWHLWLVNVNQVRVFHVSANHSPRIQDFFQILLVIYSSSVYIFSENRLKRCKCTPCGVTSCLGRIAPC